MDFAGGAGGGGGATLSEMYQSGRRLQLSARAGVAHLESLSSVPTSSSYSSAPLVGGGGAVDPTVVEEVRREVAQIQGLCAQMDRLWRSIPAKGQRDLWKRKLVEYAAFKSEVCEFYARFTNLQIRLANSLENANLSRENTVRLVGHLSRVDHNIESQGYLQEK